MSMWRGSTPERTTYAAESAFADSAESVVVRGLAGPSLDSLFLIFWRRVSIAEKCSSITETRLSMVMAETVVSLLEEGLSESSFSGVIGACPTVEIVWSSICGMNVAEMAGPVWRVVSGSFNASRSMKSNLSLLSRIVSSSIFRLDFGSPSVHVVLAIIS